jgi:hypothetical protein
MLRDRLVSPRTSRFRRANEQFEERFGEFARQGLTPFLCE